MVDELLRGFRHWWHLTAAVGVTMFAAGMTAGMISLVQLGVGLALLGIGERINHPKETAIDGAFKIESYPRRFTLLGTLFDLLGLPFIAVGGYKLLMI